MRTQPHLIAYADRLAGDLVGVRRLLGGPFCGAFAGVHVLPFYVPIDGSDAGFDPIDHTCVDPRLGSWADVAALGDDLLVMADLIVNHVSSESAQFVDWRQRGSESAYAEMFLSPLDVFGGRMPTDEERALIYRPRPTPPFHDIEFADGSSRTVWSTFTHEQIDIDVETDAGWSYLVQILDRFVEGRVGLVRLDAIGYAIKRAGTSCFMIPETFAFIDQLTDAARSRGMEVLVEIHGYHRDQIDVAERVDWVYDFALPPLAIDALTTGDAEPLRAWIGMRPNNSINVLDTHDGIGIIDVGVDQRNPTRLGLLSPERIHELVEGIHERSGGTSRMATGAAASNLDLYQVNCTFYDALGQDDQRYLAARLLQLMLPGVAQVYYVGLLAGSNDMELLEASGVGRDVNRHHYTLDEIEADLDRPVVASLLEMLRWRASDPAFDGDFELVDSDDGTLRLRWTNGSAIADRTIDLRTGEIIVH
ncbi:MAG: sucrose phosphorylase [Ilumatobacter sp.]|uniref:sucrose phosphorylase n=1 Tax=Ilumatobacter sp. TaxID=1967498 RepID=UPI00391BAE5B